MKLQERNLIGAACHLAYLIGASTIVSILIPIGFWLWAKDKDQYFSETARHVLNFQITASIAGLLIGVATGGGIAALAGVGSSAYHGPMIAFSSVPIVFGLLVFGFSVKGAYEAYHGRVYEYPVSYSFIK